METKGSSEPSSLGNTEGASRCHLYTRRPPASQSKGQSRSLYTPSPTQLPSAGGCHHGNWPRKSVREKPHTLSLLPPPPPLQPVGNPGWLYPCHLQCSPPSCQHQGPVRSEIGVRNQCGLGHTHMGQESKLELQPGVGTGVVEEGDTIKLPSSHLRVCHSW